MATHKSPLIVSALALLCAGCATESFRVPVLRPAPVHLGRFGTIAVDHFEGPSCGDFVEQFVTALRHGVNPLTDAEEFRVIDRREVDRMLDEMRERRRVTHDDHVLETLERWRSAEALLRGQVLACDVVDEVSEGEAVAHDGVIHTGYTRTCTATVSVSIETVVTDEVGEKVFDQVRFDEVASASTSSIDEPPAPIDHDALIGSATHRIVVRYLRRVLPHWDWVDVQLYTDGDLPELEIGNGYAQTGAWDDALDEYRAAVGRATGTLAESRHRALHNLGVALEFTDRFDEAKAALRESYALSRDAMTLRELRNVESREQEYRALLEQGRQGEPAVAEPPR